MLRSNFKVSILLFLFFSLCPYIFFWLQTKDVRNENQKLRTEVETLQKQLNALWYHPVIQTDRSTIKLGEEYKAYVGLSLLDMHNLPKVVLCNYKDNKLYTTKDTLVFNPYEQLFEYKCKPQKAGTYQWGGIMTVRNLGKDRQFIVIGKYTVAN